MEPVTIFSLTLAILNIFLNTISGIYDKADQLITYKDKLLKFKRTLDDCSVSFQLWFDIWSREVNPELAYTLFFGHQGWTQVQESQVAVQHYLGRLRDQLCLKEPPAHVMNGVAAENLVVQQRSFLKSLKRLPELLLKKKKPAMVEAAAVPVRRASVPGNVITKEQIQAWQKYTDTINAPTPATPDPTLVKRVIGLLGPNQKLDRLVADLKEEIDRLHRVSALHYRRMGHGKDQPKQAEEVELVLDGFNFWRFATTFWDSQIALRPVAEAANSGWYLQLHFSSHFEKCKVLIDEIVTNCRFRFVTKLTSDAGAPFVAEVDLLQLEGEFRGDEEVDDDLETALPKLFEVRVCNFKGADSREYQLVAYHEPSLWTKDWKRLLEEGHGNVEIRKAFELERARLVLGALVWIILLWGTPWFPSVCSCSFRCVLFPKTEDEINLERGEGEGEHEEVEAIYHRQENVYMALREGHDVIHCRHHGGDLNTLTRVGILLTELLLGKFIDREADTNILYYSVKDRTPIASGAVYYCFKNAKKSKWNKPGVKLSIGEMEDLIENVVNPVKKYYETIRDNVQDHYVKRFSHYAAAQKDDRFE